MDKMKRGNENEEYQLSEELKAPGYTPPQPNVFDEVKRKNIFTAISTLVSIYILYKILSAVFSSSTTPAKVTPPPTPPAVVKVQQATTPLPLIPIKAELDAETKERLAQQEQALTQVQTGLTSLQEQMNTLNTSLQGTTDQLKQLQDQLAAEKAAKQKPKVVVKPKAIVSPSYFVKALIPGRAWLMMPNGNTLTVSSGDQLPGYGVISDIDVDQGIVVTSSGAMIHYRPDDS